MGELSEAASRATAVLHARGRCRPAVTCAWVALAWLAAPRAARAQHAELDLSWSAPAGCPAQEAIHNDALGMVKLSPGQRSMPVRAQVDVSARPDGTWQALISTHHAAGSGERSLTATGCAELGRAVALVLALALSAERVAIAVAGPVAPIVPVVPVVPAVVDPARSSTLVAPSSRSAAARLGLGLDLTMGTGAVPSLGAGATLRLVVAWPHLSAQLRASAFLPRTLAVRGSEHGRAHFDAGQFGLSGCYASTPWSRFSIVGCAGGDLAWAAGHGTDIAAPGGAMGYWPRLFLEAGLRFAPLERVALRLAFEAGRALAIPRFAVAGRGVVYEPSAYGVRTSLGAELYF